MKIQVPELSLVLLIGVSGSGKSTFARKHFGKHEVVSSDECRGIVSNDENSLSATDDAFDLLNYIIGKRLKNGLLTVVDATNVQAEARKNLIQLGNTIPCPWPLCLISLKKSAKTETRPEQIEILGITSFVSSASN